eukprot:764311-Hanusia_phi.AAC.7
MSEEGGGKGRKEPLDAATFGAVERLQVSERLQELRKGKKVSHYDPRYAHFEEVLSQVAPSPESADVEDMHLALIRSYNNQLVLKAGS